MNTGMGSGLPSAQPAHEYSLRLGLLAAQVLASEPSLLENRGWRGYAVCLAISTPVPTLVCCGARFLEIFA